MFYTRRYKDGWIHATEFPGNKYFRAVIDKPKRDKSGIYWERIEKICKSYRAAQLWITRNL